MLFSVIFLFALFIAFLLLAYFKRNRKIAAFFTVAAAVFFVLFAFELFFVLKHYGTTAVPFVQGTGINLVNYITLDYGAQDKPYDNLARADAAQIINDVAIHNESNKIAFLFNENGLTKSREIRLGENSKILYDAVYTYDGNTRFRKTPKNNINGKNYIFLGCSLTFSDGVNDNETLPYYFSEKLGFNANVLNRGLSGLGILSALHLLDNYQNTQYLPNHAEHIFFSFTSEHIYRMFRHPFYGPSEHFFVPFNNIDAALSRFLIYRLYARNIVYKVMFKIYTHKAVVALKKMEASATNKYNAKFTVVVWYDDAKLHNLLLKNNFDSIFIPPDHTFPGIEGDGHPAPKANQAVAEVLYRRQL
jgi:hypothetical protein